LSELKVIPPLSPDQRAKIDSLDPQPYAKCGECGALIYKASIKCPVDSKYCPVFPRKV
jgi:hypothetical protein